jgi:predicted metalloprotease
MGGGLGGLPGGFRFPVGGGQRAGLGGGLGILVIIGLFLLFGGDLGSIMGGGTGGGQLLPAPTRQAPGNDEMKQFVSVVLADTEDVWNRQFSASNQRYQEPNLVLFDGGVDSACGFAQSAVGPFYCPLDRKVYIDLAFFRDLASRFGAPGDFAQAYVIAHEVGHHVQNLLGISGEVQRRQRMVSQEEGNALSVRLELQADCFAGVWAKHANQMSQILEQGDLEEAMNAAAAVGDDRLQQQSQGTVVPESFTHGSAEQRARWFRQGFQTGSVDQCDTFNASYL